MILPSDETPEKPGDSEPEDDFAWAAGAAPEGVPPAFADPYGSGGVEHPAPPGWREDLKRSVLEALKDLSLLQLRDNRLRGFERALCGNPGREVALSGNPDFACADLERLRACSATLVDTPAHCGG